MESKQMNNTERSVAQLSDKTGFKHAMSELEGEGRITVFDYAVDMSFDELFEDSNAEILDVGVGVELNTGKEDRKYFEFRYEPAAGKSIENHGALLGIGRGYIDDLTEYADRDALEDLDQLAEILG